MTCNRAYYARQAGEMALRPLDPNPRPTMMTLWQNLEIKYFRTSCPSSKTSYQNLPDTVIKFAPSLDRVATCTYIPRTPMKSRRALSFTRVLIARQQPRCRIGRVCTQSSSRTSHGCEQDTPRSAVYVQNGTAGYAWRQGRERQNATGGSGQSNISGDVGMRAKVSSRSQSHSIANLF
jgi:hypothetical protein